MKPVNPGEILEFALKARRLVVEVTHKSGTGHIGGSLSILPFLTCLYAEYRGIIQVVLSKAHASIGMYAVLDVIDEVEGRVGSTRRLDTYGKSSGSGFHGHISKKADDSIALSAGSLGHGLPFAIGLGVCNYLRKDNRLVVVIVGDGEIQEGTTWESLLLLQKFNKSAKMLIVVDNNSSQLSYTGFQARWLEMLAEDIGIEKRRIAGHDIEGIQVALADAMASSSASLLLLDSIKGYGIPSMHNQEKWHAGKPADSREYEDIMDEIELFGKGETEE